MKKNMRIRNLKGIAHFQLFATSNNNLIKLWRNINYHKDLERVCLNIKQPEKSPSYYFKRNLELIKRDPALIQDILDEEYLKELQYNKEKENENKVKIKTRNL